MCIMKPHLTHLQVDTLMKRLAVNKATDGSIAELASHSHSEDDQSGS